MANLVKLICGIVIGETSSEEEAEKLSDVMKKCPYLAVSGTSSRNVCSVYIVPEEKEWWLRYPETHPKETGLEKARTFVIENMVYPQKFDLKLPKEEITTAPCGAECRSCPLREDYDCSGCPATIHYKQTC